MRERELKLLAVAAIGAAIWSLPMRERELKPDAAAKKVLIQSRSPCGSAN